VLVPKPRATSPLHASLAEGGKKPEIIANLLKLAKQHDKDSFSEFLVSGIVH
jgi:hypothetical protein